jgi:hypothetical protein
MNFNTILVILKDSIAVIALRTGHPRISGSMPGMGKNFFFFFALQMVNTGSGTHPTLVFNVLPGFCPADKAAGV